MLIFRTSRAACRSQTTLLLIALLFLSWSGAAFAAKPALLLISIDGFRWDYLEKVDTPNLRQLATEGVRAEALIPVFPSLTFPSHYSMVTGLYPSQHGIVGNAMYDPELKLRFAFSDRKSIEDTRWWSGEPIWITAMKQGRIAATCFWPGTDVEIGGYRPNHWLPFNGSMPNRMRIQQILDWLALPEDQRPSFLTVYFGDVDKAGHRYGPESPEALRAVAGIDRLMGEFVRALKDGNHWDQLNVLVVSDHGMSDISQDRVVFLDDYVQLTDVTIVDWMPIICMIPNDGDGEAVLRKLAGAPHVKFHSRHEIPERFHFRNNPRITPIVGIPDDRWLVTSRERFESLKTLKGMHGYDNQLPSMHGIFIGRGPAFKRGVVVKPFLNLHLYNLMARVLEVRPAPNDGDIEAVKGMLK